MLVYFINHSTAPVNLGGAERSMILLVEDWYATDPDFEAFFITKAPTGTFVDAIAARGWSYLALPYLGWAVVREPDSEIAAASRAREDYAATIRIITEMEARRPDLVVTNTLVAPWGAFAAKTLGIPHAWFIREYGDLDFGLSFPLGKKQTLADIGLLSEAVFVNSRALRAHVIEEIDPAKVSIVYPRVDFAALEASSMDEPQVDPFPGATEATLRITMVGRVSTGKGQLDAVSALAILREQGVDARLCLLGAPEPAGFDANVVELADRLGIADRIVLTGAQANPFPSVRAADVCVVASRNEAFGRMTLEYIALGKPVVATSVGGTAELVQDGRSGFLYPPGDIDELARGLARYAADPELIRSHGLAARQHAQSMQSAEFGNRWGIEKLTALVGAPAYRLPNAARSWFTLASNAGPLAPVPATGFGRRVRSALGRTALGRRLRTALRRG